MPQLTLTTKPGFSDLPDSILAAEQFALAGQVSAISENARFGAVRPEIFHGLYSDGDTIALPVSLVDGYEYTRTELLYVWEWASTTDDVGGKPITPYNGEILDYHISIDQATGEIGITQRYHEKNKTTVEVNAGILHVFTVAIRGKGDISMTAAPAWTDQADTEVDLDAAMTEARIQALNRNGKFAAVSAEVIEMGEFTNGQTVPTPVSDVDGYAYARAEVKNIPCSLHSVHDTLGRQWDSGPGDIRRLQKSVNNSTGLVSCSTTYRVGNKESTLNHGKVRVFAFCQRSKTVTGAASFVEIDAAAFSPGAILVDADTVQLNRNCKFAAQRPEFFQTSHTHGQSVTLPTGGDGYAYVRAELAYVYVFTDTGPPTPGGEARILRMLFDVGQSTGLVSSKIVYHDPGDATTAPNDGTLTVLAVASRTHENPASAALDEDTDAGPGGSPQFDWIGNPGFEAWSNVGQEVADGWYKDEAVGSVTFQRGTGIRGINAQEITLTTGAGNAGAIASSKVAVVPGRIYTAICLRKADAAGDNGGFYFRLRFLDATLENSVYIDLAEDEATGTAAAVLAASLVAPANGATTVKSSLGVKTINGTLNFDPVWVEIVLRYADIAATRTLTLDNCFFFAAAELFFSTGTNDQGSMPPLTSDLAPFTYVSGGPATNQMFIRWTWPTFDVYRADLSQLAIPASTALPVPPAPTLSQIAGGSLGARTYHVRFFYVKSGMLFAYGASASLAVGANNLLKVASPAAIDGYDGWVAIVGLASLSQVLQPAHKNYTASKKEIVPVAFGDDWIEPTGGATTSGGTTPGIDTTAPAAHSWDLAISTSFTYYPSYDLLITEVEFSGGTLVGADPLSQRDAVRDGIVPLSIGAMTAATPAAGGGGGGSGGGCFTADARVKTPQGYRPIASIGAGDEVLVDGQPAAVKGRLALKFSGHLLSLPAGGRVTPNQRVRGKNGAWALAAELLTDPQPFRGLVYTLLVPGPECYEVEGLGVVANLKPAL